jgi:predicted transcriptional regulator
MSNGENNIMTVKGHRVFGPLEWQVLEVVWEMKKCSVYDVVRRLPQERAYTTVMTTLTRLHQKGILERDKINRKYFYSSRVSCQELKDSVVRDLIALLIEIQPTSEESIVSSLLEGLCRHDSKLFEQIVMRTTKHLKRENPKFKSVGAYSSRRRPKHPQT